MKKVFFAAIATAFLSAPAMAQTEANPMLNNALGYLDTPYGANTLEESTQEELIINADEVDCTTLVEYVLAMSMCEEQGDDMQESEFAKNLEKIRYRDGKIDGYTSRLHYITEWISDNVKKETIEDVTAAHSKETTPVSVNFMSTHPELYKHLANSPSNVSKMAEIERRISGQRVPFVSKANVPAEGLDWIKNGDIIAFTTNRPGLDVSHMGIAIYIKGNLHLLHASSKEKKVVVDRLVLSRVLDRDKNVTGIRVVRMK